MLMVLMNLVTELSKNRSRLFFRYQYESFVRKHFMDQFLLREHMVLGVVIRSVFHYSYILAIRPCQVSYCGIVGNK